MKKKSLIIIIAVVLIIAVVGVVIYTMSDKKAGINATLDLEKVYENAINLKTDKVEFDGIYSALYGEGAEILPNDVEDIYLGNFEDKGFNEENFEQAMGTINEEGKGYLSFDKVKDVQKLDEEAKTFFAKYNVTDYEKMEVNNIVIYLNTLNNSEAKNKISGAKAPLFSSLMQISKEQFTDTMGIDAENLEEAIAGIPMINVSSKMFIVVKPKSDKVTEVKEQIQTFMKNQETTWSTYLPDQYDLVKNRLEKEYGSYIVIVVSTENDTVYNSIISSNK